MHLALAQHLYWAYRDYDRAKGELAVARQTLPNESRIPLLAGYIDRRQGNWDKSLDEMKQALKLDPRNFSILQQISLSYEGLHRYGEMAATLDGALAIAPKDVSSRVRRAWVDAESRADSKSLHTAIEATTAFSHGIRTRNVARYREGIVTMSPVAVTIGVDTASRS